METAMSSTGTYDVVIVGGGMAGLIAAARAAELGLSVAVLEKGEGERYPCNARMSGGVFHVAFNDIKSPPATLRAAIDSATARQRRPGSNASHGGQSRRAGRLARQARRALHSHQSRLAELHSGAASSPAGRH